MKQGAVCSVHLARIGPRGCPMCRRSAHAQAATHRGIDRERRNLLLAAGGGLLLLLALAWTGIRSTPSEPTGSLGLDPEAFRQEIEAFETALYAADMDSRSRLELRHASGGLHVALRDHLGPFADTPSARPLMDFLWRTSIEADVVELLDRAEIRRRWEELRPVVFQPADWFARSTDALEQAQASRSGRGLPSDVDAYELAIRRYEQLVKGLELEMSSWPDSFAGGIDPQVTYRWEQTSSNVKFQLEGIRRSFPKRPRGLHTMWVGAYMRLEEAEKEIAQLFRPSKTRYEVPNLTEMRGRFVFARAKVAAARAAIERAPR